MRTILPLGALLALNLASCSGSADSFTGPGDIQSAVNPIPTSSDPPPPPSEPCEAPGGKQRSSLVQTPKSCHVLR